MTRPLALALIAAVLLASPLEAKTHRSRAVTEAFQRLHPCPSTGRTTGACPGWRKDHVRALCVGGADTVENMAWQTVEEAKRKDRWECRK